MTTQNISRLHAGIRLSEVSIFNGVAYFSGQVPNQTIDLGLKDQTEEVLQTIDRLLAAAGSDKSRILFCQIFLKDMTQIAVMNVVWDKWIPAGHWPSRVSVQAQMDNPKICIEIVVTAALMPDALRCCLPPHLLGSC